MGLLVNKRKKYIISLFILSIFLNFGINSKEQEPLKKLDIIIPDYDVLTEDGEDCVEIPQGEVITIEGEPLVPYYTISLDYPQGFIVQEVLLKKRNGLRKTSGLKIPDYIPRPMQFKEEDFNAEKDTGWFPNLEKKFEWRCLDENPDGSIPLHIDIFPFYYNKKTTKVRFYKNYSFDIRYIYSEVYIEEISTDKRIYEPGDEITIDIKLRNKGTLKDISLIGFVKENMSEKVIDILPEKNLKDLAANATLSLKWESEDIPVGDYFFEIEIKDNTGNTLGRKILSFMLGKPLGEIVDFEIKPECFRIGDLVELFVKFKNTGSCKITGACIFKIRKGEKDIKEIQNDFSDLGLKESRIFRNTWKTDKAEKSAIYHVIGYVKYDGTATLAKHAVISTNLFPKAQFNYSPERSVVGDTIKFDASKSTDKDGSIIEFKWDFGDGAFATGKEVRHAYSLPGNYKVTLVVIDNEKASGEIVKTVFITR